MDQKQKEMKIKIDNLTEDLDIRQGLWIEYLETDCDDIESICKKLITQKQMIEQIEKNIIKMINSKDSEYFVDILQSFTEFEQDVLSLLVIGIPINSVAKYKMIKQMRIIQIISCISSSPVWGEHFAKKDTNTKRKIRLKQ